MSGVDPSAWPSTEISVFWEGRQRWLTAGMTTLSATLSPESVGLNASRYPVIGSCSHCQCRSAIDMWATNGVTAACRSTTCSTPMQGTTFSVFKPRSHSGPVPHPLSCLWKVTPGINQSASVWITLLILPSSPWFRADCCCRAGLRGGGRRRQSDLRVGLCHPGGHRLVQGWKSRDKRCLPRQERRCRQVPLCCLGTTEDQICPRGSQCYV